MRYPVDLLIVNVQVDRCFFFKKGFPCFYIKHIKFFLLLTDLTSTGGTSFSHNT
jgi:hypothetical protein